MELLLEELWDADLACAPHVLVRLAADLGADGSTIREVVERLDPLQRHGLRPLPSPLPLVPSIARRFESVVWGARDRDLLLAVSVSLDDDFESLVEFDGRSVAEIVASPVGEHLVVHAGRVRFVDTRLSVWLRATTTSLDVARVHRRLSTVYDRRADQLSAGWHRARASHEHEPETAAELTTIARRLSEGGHAERALLLAREAAAHADGEQQDEARLVAGIAAVGAGYTAEAAVWLDGLPSQPSDGRRLRALGSRLVSQAFERGVVPEVDPVVLCPTTEDPEDWRHWTRAAALAAVLCAERADRRGMRVWLDALRDGAARIGAERELRDPVVALAWLIAGERDVDDVSGAGPVCGGMLRALHAAVDGDVDRGLSLLAADGVEVSPSSDPMVTGQERSPVVLAYRAVLEVLMLAWRGDIGTARDRLLEAAAALPVTLPFAGLGVVLARRLDLAVLGELGPYSRSLTAALPAGARIDTLVDHGLRSFLAGSFEDAATSVRLWAELGAPRTTMTVPALDELALIVEGRPVSGLSVEPPEIALAQELRVRLATAEDTRWRAEAEEIGDAARTLRSPFARARIETMLGTRYAIRDEHVWARIHLQHAERLFELAGAAAWARAIRHRLDRLDAREGSVVAVADPLSPCRSAWSLMLTARELEVAMRAVHGASNRDIAEALMVSIRTVEVHLGRVFAKLDVRSRVELTVLAHRTAQHL